METAIEIAARNHNKARTIASLALANSLNRPIVYCDIGALWGVDNPLIDVLRNNERLRVVGFEPDAAECQRLRDAHPKDIYIPVGVGDIDGTLPLYVTAFRACSSFLEPQPEKCLPAVYHALYRVESRPDLPVRRFDSLISSGESPCPDWLKIDAQGYELPVLQGFGSRLEEVLGVRFETHLQPLYKGQALFPEILAFMRSRGFLFRDLRITHPFDYDLLELEAFFSRDPRSVGNRFAALKLWELVHDIPPGRTISFNPNGSINWINMPM